MVARTDHLPLSWQKCAPLPNGNPPALRTWFLTKRTQRSMRGWILQVFRQFWSTGPTANSVSGLTMNRTNMAMRGSVIRLTSFPTLGVCWRVRDRPVAVVMTPARARESCLRYRWHGLLTQCGSVSRALCQLCIRGRGCPSDTICASSVASTVSRDSTSSLVAYPFARRT